MELLLLSSSRTPAGYLVDYRAAIEAHAAGVRRALFVPFAAVSLPWDEYTARVSDALPGLPIAQARSADGFPWGTWAGALNLLSWLVVTGYLVWGCRPRYRLVGLAVMPLAACLVAIAWAGGGTALATRDKVYFFRDIYEHDRELAAFIARQRRG